MLPTISLALLVLAFLLLVVRATGDETIGHGSVLSVNDGVADAYAAIPKVETLGIPTEKTGTVESRALDLDQAVIQKLAGLKDGGTFSFKYHVLAATWTRLEVLRKARTKKKWKTSVPVDTGTIDVIVPGFIESNGFEDVEAEKLNVATCVVVVSGAQEEEE